MGQKDLTLKTYLSDVRRYADLYNGFLFGGQQIVKADELERVTPVTTKTDRHHFLERTSDIVMRQKTTGNLYALWILENQETVDYSMPVRVLLKEALEYDSQIQELKRKNEAQFRFHRKEWDRDPKGSACNRITNGEYLCKVLKTDRIHPVRTLVVYWGKESWDGPRSLHEILDFGNENTEQQKQLKKLIPEFPMHLLDLSAKNDYSLYRTELKTVFELYDRRNNKKRFREYVEKHDECKHLDSETFRVIGNLTNSKELLERIDEEEEFDVCKAITDLIEEGKAEGIQVGIVIQKMRQGATRENLLAEGVTESVLQKAQELIQNGDV